MNNEEYLQEVDKLLAKVQLLIAKKNHDYTGGSGNPFKNVQLVEQLGFAQTETGILVRLCDKIARLSHMLGKTTQVNETVEDSIEDALGYLIMLHVYLNQKQN